MPTQKKFFIFFILLVAFFIISRLLIAGLIHTTYKYKNYEVKTTIPITVEVQASSVSGFAKGKVINNSENAITNKFIKVECYSKNNVLMGTKYIQIENIGAKSTFEYQVRFNYSRVDKAVIDIIDEIPENVKAEDKISDPQMSLAMLIAAIIILPII